MEKLGRLGSGASGTRVSLSYLTDVLGVKMDGIATRGSCVQSTRENLELSGDSFVI